MIFECDSCKKKYKFDESKLGNKPKVKVKCPNCGNTIEIENPTSTQTVTKISKETFSEALKEDHEQTIVPGKTTGKELLKLPVDKKLSLAVIQGSQVGEVYKISKPRIVIGRSDADFIIKDLEASRQHAAIEVIGDRVLLRDLGSTNGTFIDEKPITTAYLDNQSEFRIGTTVFILIITEI